MHYANIKLSKGTAIISVYAVRFNTVLVAPPLAHHTSPEC